MFRLSTAFLYSLAAAGLVACNGSDTTGPDQAAPTMADLAAGRSDSPRIDSSQAVASPVVAAGRLPKSFYVNPISGSDANPGTKLKPFRTLAKGLGLAISGDTMRLAAGAYSAATGEKFTNATQKVAVPAGVTILGTFADDFTSQLHGVPGETGLELLGGATVRDLNLTGFSRAIHASQGVQKFTGLYFSGNNEAIELDHTAQATLQKGSVLLNPGLFPTATGANVVDAARLTMDGGTITAGAANCNINLTGVSVRESGRLTAKNGAVFKNIAGYAVMLGETSKATLTGQTTVDRDFSLFSGCTPRPSLAVYNGSSLTLNNARVYGKGGDDAFGIEARIQATVTITGSKLSGHYAAVHLLDKTKLVVSGSTLSGNLVGINGLYAQAVAVIVTGSTVTGNLTGIAATTLKLRSSQVTGNSIGVVIDGGSADLGKLASPGNNVLSGNGQTGVQSYPGPVSSGTIYAAGNTWNSGLQDADGSGHYTQHPLVNGSSSEGAGKNFTLPSGNASFKIQL